MKIAICISGQLRTWKKCYKTWNFLNVDEIKKRKLSYFLRVGYEAHNIIESTKHNFLFYSNYPNPKKYNILDINWRKSQKHTEFIDIAKTWDLYYYRTSKLIMSESAAFRNSIFQVPLFNIKL